MTMTARQLGASALVMLLVLALAGEAVSLAARHSVPRQVMAHALERPDAETIAIGHSLIEAGFDEKAFDRAIGEGSGGGSLNLGLGSSSPVEHLILVRHALEHLKHPRRLVYGFLDMQLTTPVVYTTADLVGNHAILYYLEPEYALRYYGLSPHDRIEFEAMRWFDLMVERSAVWGRVEMLRRSLGQQGMPPVRTNRFGRSADFSMLEAADTATFVRDCGVGMGRDLAAPVREMLRLAADAGMKTYVVEMPMSASHLKSYYDVPAWPRYREHVRSLVRAAGADYVEAGRWIDDTLFVDALHLSDRGALAFSQRLGTVIRESPSGR